MFTTGSKSGRKLQAYQIGNNIFPRVTTSKRHKYKIQKVRPIPSRSLSPETPPLLPSKQWPTAPITPPRAAAKHTQDLKVPIPKLDYTAASPDASSSKTQVSAQAASSSQVRATPRPPAPNPAKQTGQQATPQKIVTPRLVNSGTAQASNATPSSQTAPKKIVSSMKPKPLAPSGASSGLQAQGGVDNSGWGSPAWSHISLTNSLPPSPTENFVSFPKDFTSSLHEKLRQQCLIVQLSQALIPVFNTKVPVFIALLNARPYSFQGSKSDPKKKKKDAKGKDKNVEKPAAKKLKMKETVADDDEVVQPTPAIRTHGPTPLKPPPVTLGISGGGFGEKVPPSAKQIKNGIESIGILKVDKDFGKFIEVDGCYWNKDVAPFVGERVDGEASLNLVYHYRPKGYDMINMFESALNTIEINNAAISSIAQQYLAGLNVSAHSESIRIQMSHLRECLNPIEKVVEEEDNGDEDVEVEVVAKGVVGPSKKKKSKSG
ncbi:hypothetical protein ARMSODRAFT_980815 [Armillaria solidipes]|uniref:Uncharacterized protein n=1 Tax=Armillaria solidipes TaxID=1076256 RepID=A0A2H3B8I7_9AGAR|nr:hypothetical protein ARMSODRAFT_980815 [Armillaria solidipes]